MLSNSEGLPRWFNSENLVGREIKGKKPSDCIEFKKSWVGLCDSCSSKLIFQSPSKNVLCFSKIGSSRIVDSLEVKDLTFLCLLEGRYTQEMVVFLLMDEEAGMDIVIISISLLM